MAKRGRPPKPTALKKLEGNPGKRQLNMDEPAPERAPSEAEPPQHLSARAKAEWRRRYAPLRNCGLLTVIDLPMFAAYCASYGRWEEAEAKLLKAPRVVKTKSGYEQLSPWLTIARQERELMKSFATEFGMSPTSRSRTRFAGAPPPPKPEQETDADGKPVQESQPSLPPTESFAGLLGRRPN